jgi:hypothetical protein
VQCLLCGKCSQRLQDESWQLEKDSELFNGLSIISNPTLISEVSKAI